MPIKAFTVDETFLNNVSSDSAYPGKLPIIAISISKNRFPKTADSNPQTIGTDAKMLIFVTFQSMLLKLDNMAETM